MKKIKTIRHSDPRPKLRNALRAADEFISKKKGGGIPEEERKKEPGPDKIVRGDPCPCGTQETFTRTESSGLGISEFGPIWQEDVTTGDPIQSTVDGSSATFEAAVGDTPLAYEWVDLWNNGASLPIEILWTDLHLQWDDAAQAYCQAVLLLDGQPDPISDLAWAYLIIEVSQGGEVLVSLESAEGSQFFSELFGTFVADEVTLNVRLRLETGAFRARIWESSGSEPGTWTYDDTVTDQSPIDGQLVSLGISAQVTNFGGGDLSRIQVSAIQVTEGDVDCIGSGNRGTGIGPFDEFNRTLGPYTVPNGAPFYDFDLGSARPGPWVYTYAAVSGFNIVENDGEIQIDGESLVASLIGGFGDFMATVYTADASDDVYELTIAFEFDTIPSIPTSGGFESNTSNLISLYINSSPSQGFNGEINVQSSYLGGYPSGWYPWWDVGPQIGDVVPWTPVANRIFFWKIQYDRTNNLVKAKLWSEVESEPGWQVSKTADEFGPPYPQSGSEITIEIEHNADGNSDDPGEYDRLITWKIHWIRDNTCGQSLVDQRGSSSGSSGLFIISEPTKIIANCTRISSTAFNLPSDANYVYTVYVDGVPLKGGTWYFSPPRRITLLSAAATNGSVSARYVYTG